MLVTAPAAMAQGPKGESTVQGIQFTPSHGSRSAANGFDWLAPTARTTKPPVTLVHQIGRGSYICAPAGFGRKSRCYQN